MGFSRSVILERVWSRTSVPPSARILYHQGAPPVKHYNIGVLNPSFAAFIKIEMASPIAGLERSFVDPKQNFLEWKRGLVYDHVRTFSYKPESFARRKTYHPCHPPNGRITGINHTWNSQRRFCSENLDCTILKAGLE